MIAFKTKSGSEYEVNDSTSQVRRPVAGSHESVCVSAEWKTFAFRSSIEVGQGVVFVWGALPDDCVRSTSTSCVVEVAQ